MNKLLLSIPILLASYSVHAGWLTEVEESIFGDNKALMIGEIKDSKSGIIFLCDKDTLSVSYLELERNSDMNPVPVTFLMKIDSNPVIEFNTTLQKRNSDSIEARGNDKVKIISLLKQLSVSKQRFLAGISVDDTDIKYSFSGNVLGSTAAVTKFTNACNIKL
ncbi:hypothetical protein ISO55_04255 [Morganella morganii subsp. morganii]|uniref:hypothetical protein n=1 Tax=Morganella morganii TaxID=582 RepID=UPI001BD92E48|nr:hypothetical protein [Morganella morganii]MBT0366188.1 hypothetical protein [Morganella morganii subsp. morganii]